MLADLDLLLTAVFATADDLLGDRQKNARRRVTDAELVALAVAQAVMDIASASREESAVDGARAVPCRARWDTDRAPLATPLSEPRGTRGAQNLRARGDPSPAPGPPRPR
jgi:hypothetical protein